MTPATTISPRLIHPGSNYSLLISTSSRQYRAMSQPLVAVVVAAEVKLTGHERNIAYGELELDDGSGAVISAKLRDEVYSSVVIAAGPKSIDIGTLVKVKGTLQTNFEQHSFKVDKVQVLRDPAAEFVAWQERNDVRRRVLDIPWQPDIKKKLPQAMRHHERVLIKEEEKKAEVVDVAALDLAAQNVRMLKRQLMQYLQKWNVQVFTLGDLSRDVRLMDAAKAVAHQRYKATSDESQRILNTCAAELVDDGLIVMSQVARRTFCTVGLWNLGPVIASVLEQFAANGIETVRVKDVWEQVKGLGFAKISKQQVREVMQELGTEREHLPQLTRRMGRSSRSKPTEEPLLELPEDGSEEESVHSGDMSPGAVSEDGDDDEEEDEEAEGDEDEGTDSRNPYTILAVDSKATEKDVRSAYRKLALKTHPDKVPAAEREEADVKFKEIAWAYAILSDDKKRKLYDTTGRTDGEGGDFDWDAFMTQQYKVVIDEGVIEQVKKEYQNSEEERRDVVAAYKKAKGDWTRLFEQVMLSQMLGDDDETRFRRYIDEAIAKGEKRYPAYDETKEQKASRIRKAEKEAAQAEKLLAKLKSKDKSNPATMTEGELGTLIRSRQNNTLAKMDEAGAAALAKHYEEKYGTPKKKKKRSAGEASSEPTEAEFLAAQERIKQRRQK
ncbi:hypothetical protein BCR37DRAFT_404517 [Protomyces lactucae-debilis]|uniref:J domain-containing protein n=1 Tax=Protomyces lactucae-debilis TaxID=2754530 RepID=A0A1Y2FBM0_PROLT|nr:uncharacterized protein BCR37DRAFT_404517 [Protomyces lactucae-debilis]ORY81318.1 hypothetical protein BCR37DRAFT_404517 [Protomyces lactucae-debilis]